MSLAERFASLIERAQESVVYWRDIAINDFTRELHDRIRASEITHAALAERLGTSRPYVTKQLNGGNFTLETMVKFAMALDSVVRIRLEDRDGDLVSGKSDNTGSGTCVVVDMPTRPSVPSEGSGTATIAARWGR